MREPGGRSPRGARAPRTGRRRGASYPRGVPFVLWALLIAIAAAWWVATFRRDPDVRAFTRIDTARSRFEAGASWVDPYWGELIAAHLASFAPVDAEDPDALEALAASLTELSFVQRVGAPEVLWPDGLAIPVRVADPVACIAVGRHFMTVGADGRVLPGLWNAPPAHAAGWFPVLGPLDGALDGLRAGDVVGPPQSRALSVATSMWQHLGAGDFEALGRVVIDAERSPRASVEEPGTILWLESGRLVLFGRAPDEGAPGELPAGLKWRSVSRALELLDEGREDALDWDLLDVRWDVPEIRARGASTPPEALGDPPERAGDG